MGIFKNIGADIIHITADTFKRDAQGYINAERIINPNSMFIIDKSYIDLAISTITDVLHPSEKENAITNIPLILTPVPPEKNEDPEYNPCDHCIFQYVPILKYCRMVNCNCTANIYSMDPPELCKSIVSKA